MEPRFEFKTEAFQAILDETAKVDPRAKKNQTGAILTEWKSGFFDKLWAGK